ncbi:MAG: Alkyl hydroperoxide reductase and/or thiol-specific antioxidant family (AhpC/TSA) protein [Olavius algarvensis Gamma 3 endosymbiont]|nr:MAG: Alkyl hydroperoxide reductase and/or thiol-specific antioxidant family (AhpC/TSA) protein [Olavius algarvensis Gamma 3 endosymbiont]
MAETPSTMLGIGTQAPDFSLPEPASGNKLSLADYAGKPLLVVFSCNHCPYVLHILESFTEFANEVQRQGLAVVMISANDITGYPADSPPKMAQLAQAYGFEFPYLYDESQQVARAYRAACTPDFFLFDSAHRLVYRGQYDASRPGNRVAIDGRDMRAAVDAVLAGNAPAGDQIPSVGCNIKWRAGNEPDYF